MSNVSVIKSYLVSLGFDVNQPQVNKFTEALKRAGRDAERVVGGMAGAFLKGGAAITASLAAIAAGTVGLMDHVASADLGYQLFARRMFMSADAAKKLKIATDSLGYSLEEIVWGPPELAERYHALIKDQNVMLKNLGGADFEKQMRAIRDIRFQFTRMGVEVQYLGMQLTKSIMDKLFGGPTSLEKKLEKFNEWFQGHIPQIADTLANVIAPGFAKIGEAVEKIFTKKNVDWAVNVAVKGAENISLLLSWITSQDKLGLLFGDKAHAMGSSILGSNSNDAQRKAWWSGDPNWRRAKQSKGDLENLADSIAREHGIDPSLFKGIIRKESSWNPNAVNPTSGAFGLGQLMPGNMSAFGFTGDSAQGNLEIAAELLKQYLDNAKGNESSALKSYGGFRSKKTIDEQFPGYYNDIQRYRREYDGGATVQPQSYRPSVDVGGITIHVASSNASPEEIANATVRRVREELDKKTQRVIAQHQGAYA